MLLYTNKANNVFHVVDEMFGDRDISPVGKSSRASSLPQWAVVADGFVFGDTILVGASLLAIAPAQTTS